MFREDDTRTDGLINNSCPYRSLPASDFWSIKVPLLIPFAGLILCTTNYIIQTIYIHSSVYLLLISDAIFGITGGYISVISTTLSYGVKMSSIRHRSYRIAGVEAAIGLGGTIGYLLSGTFRQAFGYSYTFLFMLVLQVIGFFYILILAKDSEVKVNQNEIDGGIFTTLLYRIIAVLINYYNVITKRRKFRSILNLNLFALGIELLIFEGLADIQYSYFRYKLSWGDREYGWFSGLSFGLNTVTVLFLYPLLRSYWLSDGILGCLGLSIKILSLYLLAVVSSSTMAYFIVLFTAFNRFVSTGFRAFISSIIQTDEQGMMFSLIAVLEGLTTLLATSIFNNLYPKTLSFFPGLCYVASASILIVSFLILGISDRLVARESLLEAEPQESSGSL